MKTKQEEIREVIDTYTDDGCLYLDVKGCFQSSEGYCSSGKVSYNCLMKRLGELGVVIKVKGRLPNVTTTDSPHRLTEAFQHGVRDYRETVKNAGFVAVEPLIKEE